MVTKGSVLVVDDEVNLCRILGAKLAKSGYNVVAVHDGVQAVERVRESDFDVVLLDLILPKMDGLTALAQIRALRSALPVIVMTACESAEALEVAKSHGVSAYVNKPFDLDSLVLLVQDISRRSTPCAGRKVADSSVLFAKNQAVTLEIQNGGGVKVYPSCVFDKDERTLSVLAPCTEQGLVEVLPLTSVRVGLAAKDAHYSFTSRVIQCGTEPEHILVLDKPGVIYRAQRREHCRLPLRVPIRYSAYSEDSTLDEDYRLGETRDLSLGGMSVVVPDEILPGEMLRVELRPKTREDVISVVAKVMRAGPSGEADAPGNLLGCRFTQSDESLRKLLDN